ncbi:hypothetical protein BJ322DRAFT_801853 [Thelephora terrestris]|uniref:Uncharacterized protein n=1 Tax=Thelephora terrestris TaxID=56493 RepID=A0A9P6HE62_9AGAM|nr:hypothetical protein BJ322DRAFT_801853 [Thelephora terrestris]
MAEKAMELSNSIFNPGSESHHTSLEEWKRRISDPASSIIYLVPQLGGGSSALPGDDEPPLPPRPVAFLFAHPRSHPEPLKNGFTQSVHIWFAGVSKEYRGRRCLDTVVDALVELEKKRRGSDQSSMSTLTVCTTPSRFPSMWNWLRARPQWVAEKEWDGGKVMLSWTEQYIVQ